MPGIVSILLLLVSITGPVAVAMLVLGSDADRRRRHILIAIAVIAAAAFSFGTYLEVASLPTSGTGLETGPQDAPVFAAANTALAAIVYLAVWAACVGIRRLLRSYREHGPAQAPLRPNRAQRRSSESRGRKA